MFFGGKMNIKINKIKDNIEQSKIDKKNKILRNITNNFDILLNKIEGHLDYEKEIKDDLGNNNKMVLKYSPDNYRLELQDTVLSRLNKNNDEIQQFVVYTLLIDLNKFNDINDNIYSEILYVVFDILSNLLFIDISVFIKNIYQYLSQNPDKVQAKLCKENIKKYLILSEAYSLRIKESSTSNNIAKENDETKDDNKKINNRDITPGILQVENLFFQYGISNEKELKKMLRLSSFSGLILFLISIFIIFVVDMFALDQFIFNKIGYFIELPIIILIVGVISLGIFVSISIFKHKKNNIRKSLVKVYSAASIGESEVFESLKDKFGNKLKKILKI